MSTHACTPVGDGAPPSPDEGAPPSPDDRAELDAAQKQANEDRFGVFLAARDFLQRTNWNALPDFPGLRDLRNEVARCVEAQARLERARDRVLGERRWKP